MSINIYDKLLEYTNIPRAWTDWADYRKNITDYILENTKEKTSLMILGAGKANDYDLRKIAGHFKSLILTDIDTNSTREAVKKQLYFDVEPDETVEIEIDGNMCSIRVEHLDLVGVIPDQYRAFADGLQNMVNVYGINTDIGQMASFAKEMLDDIFSNIGNERNPFLGKNADYIIAFGLHSQLNSMFPWIWEAFMGALGARNASVHEYVRDYNKKLIPRLTDQILEASNMGVIFGLEESRIGIEGGVEGAVWAYQDLLRRREEDSLRIEMDKQFIWPFDLRSNIIYKMRNFIIYKY